MTIDFKRQVGTRLFALFVAGVNCLGFSATAQSIYSQAYTFTTFAGIARTGSADGVGTDAQFDSLLGVTVDSQGIVYVADSDNNTIRKITPTGVVTTLAGVAGSSGADDGTGSAARFDYPQGLAADAAGNIYVADGYNNTIRKITPAGVVTTLAGVADYYGTNDGPGDEAVFDYPKGVAVDSAGYVYVADSDNDTIRKITPAGFVTTLAGSYQFDTNGNPIGGSADGTGSAAQFNFPEAVAVDGAGNLYVADSHNNTIRKVTAGGVVTTLAGLAGHSGTNDGTGQDARFYKPGGIAVDGANNIYVADSDNDTIRKITPDGVVTTLAGVGLYYGNVDGTGTNAQFSFPNGIAVAATGNIYVADTDNSTLRQITTAGLVTTLAGVAVSSGTADGTGSDARFTVPWALAAGPNGEVYVADTGNSAIRKITSAGLVTTLAGLTGIYGSSDGVGNEAQFHFPQSVAVDNTSNVFVADTGNDTIREITPAGVVTTIAGLAGSPGTNDGPGVRARFYYPLGITVDNASNVFVADSVNDTIRKISPVPGTTNWRVVTIAGLAGVGGSADGTNDSARFLDPTGIAVDSLGNLYVADTYNYTIRQIKPVPGTANWAVSTIAGSPGIVGSADGIGTNALFGDGGYAFELYGPYGIAVDAANNIYVADSENSTIRRIVPFGKRWIVSTIAGSVGQYSFANGAGSAALFDFPDGVTVDKSGNIYVADTDNNIIRKGVFSQYTPATPGSVTPPVNNAALVVTLLPPGAGGQWRFPWELSWRNSGEPAVNLVQGEYPVEFKTVPGYLIPPLVAIAGDGSSVTNLVAITNGGTTYVTNQYYATISTVDTNNGGSLTVNIGPSPPNGAGWRFLGDSTAYNSPDSSTNLAAGTYLIEFAPVTGFVTPSAISVQVVPGAPTVLTVTYLLASPPPSGVLLPAHVLPAQIQDPADYPFAFNGQLQTDVGYGSGVAVQTNVVLTAAHLIFDDQTLSYVTRAYWFFQEEAGYFEPEGQQARGWYVLTGYASQRTNDVLGGLGPDQSSPQSRNLDVAALYFNSPVANGGYGGSLPSDATPNTWLTGTAEKMLVGYPVDGSQFGVANIVNGRMYEIGPQPYPLTQAPEPVADQQIYTASWMLSYPGNSGGPFYVQYDGYYYPAAVYLGTLFNGVQPYASAVRAIDSNVLNLVTLAATLGNSGTNNSGGGVIIVIPGQGVASNPGLVEVTITPPAAVAAGAAWKFSSLSDADFSTKNPSALAVTSSAKVQLQFKAIPGWNLPTNQSVSISPGLVASVTATYTPAGPLIQSATQTGTSLTFSWAAVSNQTFQIQTTTDLSQNNWTPLAGTITATNSKVNVTKPIGAIPQRFFRVVQLP